MPEKNDVTLWAEIMEAFNTAYATSVVTGHVPHATAHAHACAAACAKAREVLALPMPPPLVEEESVDLLQVHLAEAQIQARLWSSLAENPQLQTSSGFSRLMANEWVTRALSLSARLLATYPAPEDPS